MSSGNSQGVCLIRVAKLCRDMALQDLDWGTLTFPQKWRDIGPIIISKYLNIIMLATPLSKCKL